MVNWQERDQPFGLHFQLERWGQLMPSHGKLHTPTIAEVVLEMHFAPTQRTQEFIGPLQAGLESRYSTVEQLNYQTFTFELPDPQNPDVPVGPQWQTKESTAPDLPRYRFSDGAGMYVQIGDGILTVNCTNYQGFDMFFEHAQSALTLYVQAARPVGFSRLALRYINLFPQKRPADVLSWGLRDPLITGEQEATILGAQQSMDIKFGAAGNQRITMAVPQRVGDRIGLTLDIEQFTESAPPTSLDDASLIEQWVSQAHELIWRTFTAALTPQYLEEIRYGTPN